MLNEHPVQAQTESSEAVEIFRPTGPISSPLINTSYTPSRSIKSALALFEQLRFGTLHVTLPNGNTRSFKGPKEGAEATLRLFSDKPIKRFFTQGTLGFCEAYIDGQWSSPDITALFTLFIENTEIFEDVLSGSPWAKLFTALPNLRANATPGTGKTTHSHFEIGNDFFSAWLDETMSYSSGYFADGITDLRDAQIRKYGELAYRLDIQPGDHVLELGCGWGGFAEYAATYFGCTVTALTLSEEQYTYAKTRIEKTGLSDKVTVQKCDYREITGQYDRIASIGLLENIGERQWPTFFSKINEHLRPGGRVVLQVVTIDDNDFENYRRGKDYIQKHIFPGAGLPSKAKLFSLITGAGLCAGDQLSFGFHFGYTFKLWNENFQNVWLRLKRDFGYHQRFKRKWEQYLSYCEAGFNTEKIDVILQTIDKAKT